MNAFFKFVSVAAAAILPTIASASIETVSSSCSSNLVVSLENGYHASCDGDFSFVSGSLLSDTLISITANGLLSVGEQAILAAPNIRLFANSVTVDGSLNALGGIIEINSPNSVQLGTTAKLDGKSISLSVAVHPDLYVPKPSLSYAGSVTVGSGSEITNGSFNSSIGLLSGIQGGAIEISGFVGICGGCSASAVLLPTVSQVPEPSNLSMLAMGLFAVVVVVRRKTKNR